MRERTNGRQGLNNPLLSGRLSVYAFECIFAFVLRGHTCACVLHWRRAVVAVVTLATETSIDINEDGDNYNDHNNEHLRLFMPLSTLLNKGHHIDVTAWRCVVDKKWRWIPQSHLKALVRYRTCVVQPNDTREQRWQCTRRPIHGKSSPL